MLLQTGHSFLEGYLYLEQSTKVIGDTTFLSMFLMQQKQKNIEIFAAHKSFKKVVKVIKQKVFVDEQNAIECVLIHRL